MSLATRCPVCQTVFRVVQDQLKVSEGWVRCGRCAKVFNAFEGLFDLEREFPALRQPTPSQRVLEDLATRNRQPRASTPWQDEFDSPSSPGEMPQPAPAAASPAASAPVASRPAAAVASAPAPVQRLPAQSAPPPIAAARAPAAPVAQPPTPVGAAPSITSRETTPWAARVVPAPPATAKDEGATIPPTTVAPPGKTAEPA
ncbi:MAG TPA: zinc-ribbon domain-containing protein, partial [Burkholderiaceae bacterium]|nr:zinc-ribbon domain-containing protein [Burkholderiaceae bacterium]